MNGAKAAAKDVARQIRVLVVDDEQVITEMLSMGLSYEGFDVRVARTGLEALELAKQVSPDIMVLDIMLPGMDGLEVCRRLSGKKDMAIIMLTARGEVDDRIAGLDIGADDYLAKPFAFKELLARIKALTRRPKEITANVLKIGNLTLDQERQTASRDGREIRLTTKEFEILKYLMLNPGKVVSHHTLIEEVWGEEADIFSNSIETHIANIRKKIAFGDSPDLIKNISGRGYIIE